MNKCDKRMKEQMNEWKDGSKGASEWSLVNRMDVKKFCCELIEDYLYVLLCISSFILVHTFKTYTC